MKRLQMAGNRPVVLVGGGTGYIGDPSGRSDMRSMMTPETIQHNCDCFKKQMERFIDFGEGKAIMVNNADWLLKLNYIELLREVGACFSVNNMLRAECYKQRMEKGLSFLEFNYMIMQSYDFYYLFQHYGCNMQFGGDDQWSNMLGGTELIRRKLGKDAHAMTITLLMNSEGKKMGKTASGAVWLDPNKTSPYDFYQYWRNVGDADVLKCIRMLTFLPLEQIDEMDKWEGSQLNRAKEILAYELTALVHGEEEAPSAQRAQHPAEEGIGSQNRVQMVERTPNALLLSIHQNYFPEAKYHGAQVFYAKTPESEALAALLQQTLRTCVNPENHRREKPAEAVYLMEKVSYYGSSGRVRLFLSNEPEAEKLTQRGIKKQLAGAVCGALCSYLKQKGKANEGKKAYLSAIKVRK